MATLVSAMASSHAFTFRPPEEWDEFRARIDAGYERRYKRPPASHPGVMNETLDANARRYSRIRDGLAALAHELRTVRPTALILIGDDQEENFSADLVLPQLAIFLGEQFSCGGRRGAPARQIRAHREVATTILNRTVEDGFDMAMCKGFKGGTLTSHAHVEIIENLVGDLDVPVVPVFVNALHIPGPAPVRCYDLGMSIRRALDARPAGERFAIYASGGLSHFTAGFPWREYTGPFTYGAISSAFDQQFMAWLELGEGERTRTLSSADLLHHGNVEMRSWITLLGAVGARSTRLAVYEPFYRGMMGMAAAIWDMPQID